ncbi:MAG: zinc-ribbon domain-containing protein [Oscillospiraceae bacterium]|nr:zinc-ribbon domain-containing protein [Oscillospiraceae bacterium]
MFCKNCRTQLNDGAAFCHNCGTAVTMPNAEAVQTENVAENTEAKVMFDAPTASSTENVAPIYQMPQYTAPVEEPQSDKKGFSIASLVLGICSFLPCCCVNFILSILAVIFGIIGIKSSDKNLSIIGIILAAVSFVLGIITVILYMFVLEANTEGFSYYFGDNMYY